ncbi:MAG: hypothetical protein LBC92_03570 [Rickettsiales bacterium]|jgi:hypothetical protein|nr:hypothetical protein [Rickettsiales bacterium]
MLLYLALIIFVALIVMAYVVVIGLNHDSSTNLDTDSDKLHPLIMSKKYKDKKSLATDGNLKQPINKQDNINLNLKDEEELLDDEDEEDDDDEDTYRDKKNEENNLDNAILSDPNSFDIETLKEATKRMGNTEKGKFIQKALEKKLKEKNNNRSI